MDETIHPLLQDIEGYHDWEGSLSIYYARNGDVLLLHQSGKVGWLVCDQRKIIKKSEDFSELVKYYVGYKKLPYPFDSYGPESEEVI